MTHRIGVDIGGTFTDFALMDDATGTFTIHKQLTTPADPSSAVLEGIDTLLKSAAVSIRDVTAVIHGSTLVTNALIERKGAVTGMLVTQGFRDVLDIARETRYDLYDLRIRLPAPLVPRSLRIEVAERIGPDGKVQRAPVQEEVLSAVDGLVDRGIASLAICFLHSFTNPEHETLVTEWVRARHPSLFLSSSADVLPYMREYERWTTTTMNAYTQPIADGYLSRIETGLESRGFSGNFHIMTSNGGCVTADTARRFPVRMLESGPAAGVLMSSHHGKTLGIERLLSFDMGGTTAKGAIVRDGTPIKKYEIEVARIHEFKPGSGLPARVPVIDMIEIGAGGGSIAELDDRGVIRVGPRSAGADPGPACYGRGGDQATLSDANLLLGIYDPTYFLGGKMRLDPDAAERVIRTRIANPLRTDVRRAAWGIHEVINEDVARAFRVHASELGFDYRTSSMIAFGGSGPAHAARIARKLRIPRVVFPIGSGVMSAFGMLVSPLSFETAKSQRVVYDESNEREFQAILDGLAATASAFLRRAGVAQEHITFTFRLDMRYVGQGYEIEVQLPSGTPLAATFHALPQMFAENYAAIFALSYLKAPLEIMNWKVEAQAPAPAVSETHLEGGVKGRKALKGTRQVFLGDLGRMLDIPVYDRYALSEGATIEGPALIEEQECTCLLGTGDSAKVDPLGNLIVDIQTAAAHATAA